MLIYRFKKNFAYYLIKVYQYQLHFNIILKYQNEIYHQNILQVQTYVPFF